jgi:hypothetical protein
VDLSLTAYANASKLYCNKKAAQVKEAKTIQASTKVLQQVEEQTRKVISAVQAGTPIKTIRKVFRILFLYFSFFYELLISIFRHIGLKSLIGLLLVKGFL